METKTLTKRQAAQTRRMLMVFALIARGMPITTACEQVGVSSTTYRNWIVENPESVQVIQKSISAMERVNLASIATARSRILDRLILAVDQQGDNALSPRALLEIDTHLHNLQREIEDKHGAGVREDLKAKEFLLTGPKLHKAENQATFNVKARDDGSLDFTVMKAADIIDASSTDESGESPDTQIFDQPSQS